MMQYFDDYDRDGLKRFIVIFLGVMAVVGFWIIAGHFSRGEPVSIWRLCTWVVFTNIAFLIGRKTRWL